MGFQRTLNIVSRSRAACALGILALGLSGCAAPGPEQAAPVAADSGIPAPDRVPNLPPAQIASLESLSAPEVIARLGRPDFTRHDAPAELWQYRGASCVLDLFLYPDGQDLKVVHAQSRNRQGAEAVSDGNAPCSPFMPDTTASAS